MMLVMLSSPVPFRNKDVKQLCVQLPVDKRGEDEEGESVLAPLHAMMRDCNVSLITVGNPMEEANDSSSNVYKSVSGKRGELPFVQCYNRVNEGALFPMEEGLLFFKPPMFYHRSVLHSIACGRGKGSGGTRYVDMTITVADNKESKDNKNKNQEDTEDENREDNLEEIEFTNISREELKSLNEYIYNVLMPAMSKDVGTPDAGGEDVENKTKKNRVAANIATQANKQDLQQDEDTDDSDEDDDEYNMPDDDTDDDDSTGDEDSYPMVEADDDDDSFAMVEPGNDDDKGDGSDGDGDNDEDSVTNVKATGDNSTKGGNSDDGDGSDEDSFAMVKGTDVGKGEEKDLLNMIEARNGDNTESDGTNDTDKSDEDEPAMKRARHV